MPQELKLVPVLTVRRGLARRCPACGSGGLFRAWFSMRERCPRCSLVFERIEGQWLGSLGLNTIVTFVLLFVLVVAGVFATAPDVAVVPLVLAAVVVGGLFPILFFPWSRTIWLAVDLLMRPPTDAELDVTADGVRVQPPSTPGRPPGHR
ncbi:MAG: DUF983 domain-containing protein [Actinomycetota bacterium]